ncbi:hypothetical protein Pelo_13349 [Pelomyxa schiedti]|nr:hypothetical protein Pelo_13349 [Pelomyxa schiedti]
MNLHEESSRDQSSNIPGRKSFKSLTTSEWIISITERIDYPYLLDSILYLDCIDYRVYSILVYLISITFINYLAFRDAFRDYNRLISIHRHIRNLKFRKQQPPLSDLL